MTNLDATTLITERIDADWVVETPTLARSRRLVSWAAERRHLIQMVGPSGAGKTTAAIDAAGLAVTSLGVKAARVAVPHHPAPRLLAHTLLHQITGDAVDTTLDKLESMLVAVLREEHYLLVIDEAQNLNTGGIERLRTLWERASFGGVFVGDDRLTKILGASPQLESRIDRKVAFDRLAGEDLYDIVRQLHPVLADAPLTELRRVDLRCCGGNLRRWHAWLNALLEIQAACKITGPATPALMEAACVELG